MITVVTLDEAKTQLNVTHALRDGRINQVILQASREAEHYLDRTLYDDQALLDQDVADSKITVERALMLDDSIKGAVLLLIEYYYDGTSSPYKEKTKEAANNILNQYVLVTA